MNDIDLKWMQYALTLAQKAKAEGEVPVGAVLIKDNNLIGEGYNCPILTHDPTAHAEIQAIRMATKQVKNYRLNNTTLYITLEPCAMCAGSIIQARITRVVFGAKDPKAGAVESIFNVLQNNKLNHTCEITSGILADECSQILTSFFRERRKAISS